MKSLFISCSAMLCFATFGCESVRSDIRAGMKEKIDGPAFRTKIVAGTTRDTYEAARVALPKMNFRLIRGGAAQGRIEALREVASTDSLKNSRQVRLQIVISPSGDGSEVAALFSEIHEGDISKDLGLKTEQSLRDTQLYDVLFRQIEVGLLK